MYRILPVTLLLAFLSVPVTSAELSQDDFEFFKKASYSGIGDLRHPSNIEDQFFEIAVRTESPSDAVTQFSVSLGISTERALGYVSALVEVVRYREQCTNNQDYDSCRFEPGATLYDALVNSGFDDQSGRLATSIGKAIWNYSDVQRQARSTYIRVVYDHPARASIYASLYAYFGDLAYAAVHAATAPANIESAVLFRQQAQSFSACEASQYGSFLALLDIARQKAVAHDGDRTIYLIFTEALIWSQLRFGMVSEAVESFSSHSNELRGHLTRLPPEILDGTDRQQFTRQNANLLLDLAYAMYSLGDSEGAADLLNVRDELLEISEVESNSDAAVAAVLRDIMSPHLSVNTLYEMAIYGHLQDDTAPPEDEGVGRFDNDGRWLFAMKGRPVHAQTVFAERLRDAGYDGMADYLVRDFPYKCRNSDDPLASIEELLPESYFASKALWASQIEQAWQGSISEGMSANASEGVAIAKKRSRPLAIEEHPLPSEFIRPEQTEPEDDEEYWERNLVPDNVQVPVEPSFVVRYSEEEGEKHIIYQSSAIDQPGEIPAYGFWYQSTFNGGRNWSAPLYLGIQQFFPYVVVADSRLPLLSGGKLQIEVEVREIDPASITFPPLDLCLKREDRDLYISIDLNDLQLDSDEDYMTDIIEYRLGLDPNNPDTDGDGVPDGIDSLPLTAYDPDAPREDTELAFAILETIHGYEHAAIVVQPSDGNEDADVLAGLEKKPSQISDANSLYLIADPKIFAGVRLEERLLVYTEDEIERISDGQAPFYPARVLHLFRKENGREIYVIWSASWTGGEFVVKCREGECAVEDSRRWIT